MIKNAWPKFPRAIIFDMDGVLLHSATIHAKAFQEVLKEIGIQEIDYATIAGLSTIDAIVFLIQRNGLSITSTTIKELAAKKSLLSFEMLKKEMPITISCNIYTGRERSRMHAQRMIKAGICRSSVR